MGNESNFPTGDFKKIKFLENDDVSVILDEIKEDIINTLDNNEYGYFIECDLEYPAELKGKSENFPLCPYRTKADPNLFSDYMNSVKEPNYKPTHKLMYDLTNNYLMHYRMFKFYINMGMKITKTYTIYTFRQSSWLSKYTDHNTQKRTNAKQSLKRIFII